jgi:recombination protein U
VEFMRDFEAQGGLAFFLLFFSEENLFYYLPFRDLMIFWERMEAGGRKSFRRDELSDVYYLPRKGGFLVPYLEGISLDLKNRD